MRPSTLTRFAAIPVIAAFMLTGCSGGTTKPSTSSIADKLSKESELETVKDSAGDKYDDFINCIADFLHDKGKASDLKEYVDGKRSIDDVRSSSADEDDAQAKVLSCAKDLNLTTS